MSTRLARKLVELSAAWDAQEPELLADREARLHAAIETVKEVCEEAPENVGDLFVDCLLMAGADGFIGGKWDKVKESVRQGFPKLWDALAPLFEQV